MRSRLLLWGRRVSSWFRQVVLPTRTEHAEIREAEERPWLDEQMRTWSSNVPRRWNPLNESITGETAEMRVAYREAIAEPTVKAALLGKIGQVLFLDVQVVPENKKDPLEIECAEFIRSQLIGPSGTFFDIGWPILTGGLIDGFSVAEKLYGTIERGKFAGRWGLRGLKAKDTKRLQIETDTYRNITGIWSAQGNAGTFFDPNDFVVFSWLKFFENPMGMSDLRAVYRAVKMIVHAIKLRMIFLDKYTGPYLKGKYTDPSRRAKLRAALEEARGKGYVMLQSGQDDVEVVDLAARGTSDFQAAIDDLRKEVAIAITGSFLTMLEGSDPGVRGNSEVQKDTAEIFAELLVAHCVSAINTQVIPDLVEPNYGNRIAYPRFGLSAIDPSMILKELEIDKSLQDLGADLSASEVYDRAGRSPPKDAADILKPKQQPGPQASAVGFPGLPSSFVEGWGQTDQHGRRQIIDDGDGIGVAQFTDEEIAQFARAGLVPKKITDKNGHKRTVWVKGTPDGSASDGTGTGAATPAPAAKAPPAPSAPAPKPTVSSTIAHISGLRSNFTTEGLLALAQSLHGHTVAELKEIKTKLGLKASGTKNVLAQKIAERALSGGGVLTQTTPQTATVGQPQKPASAPATKTKSAAKPKTEPSAELSKAKAAKIESDISDSYNHLIKFVEFHDGVVEIPRLWHEAKDRDPSLTLSEFHAELERMSDQRKIELRQLNEVQNAQEPGLAINKNDKALGKRMYYYIRFKDSADRVAAAGTSKRTAT